MIYNALTAIALWGLTFYVMGRIRQIEATNRTLKKMPAPASISWMAKAGYIFLGVGIASCLFVGSAIAGVSPLAQVQDLMRITPALSVTPTIGAMTPTGIPTPTGTPMPMPTSIPTAPAATLPAPFVLPGDDGTPGWMKTPNGQGGGQFQTPPGQGGIPPGQEKKTPEADPKPTKDNGSNQGGNSSKK